MGGLGGLCRLDLDDGVSRMKGRRNAYADEGDCLQRGIAAASISPTEMLYGWGKAVVVRQYQNHRFGLHDRRLKVLGLAPVSSYPACDWCAKKSGNMKVCGRWWMHRRCWMQAMRESPVSTGLPKFTNWEVV